MSAWRMSIIVELEADDLDAAGEIGKRIWEKCAPLMREIEGVRWMLPVGDFKEREPFAVEYERNQ